VVELDPVALRAVLRRFATGVAIVTAWDGQRARGTTVNSFCSVSLRPPLVMVAFDRRRRMVSLLNATGRYAVNILGEDSMALSDCFAGGPRPRGEAAWSEAEGAPDLCGAGWHHGERTWRASPSAEARARRADRPARRPNPSADAARGARGGFLVAASHRKPSQVLAPGTTNG
jgi:hypothetical protein